MTVATAGIGLMPVGFQFNFRRKRRFQPTGGINGGFAFFNARDVPVPSSANFNFMFSLGPGLQIFSLLQVAILHRHGRADRVAVALDAAQTETNRVTDSGHIVLQDSQLWASTIFYHDLEPSVVVEIG